MGKTTALKLMVERSLREATADGVLYDGCDLDRDPDTIRQVVQAARAIYPHHQRWRIFLDEITTVPDWPRAVKWLWDNTPARGDTFVLTGSSAADIRAGAERMPGRRGAVGRPDRLLLPLSFQDFARLHDAAPPTAVGAEDFFRPQTQQEARRAALRLSTLQTLLDRYVRTGGFPTAVIEEHTAGQVSDATVRALWDAIEGEILRQGRDPLRAYRLLYLTDPLLAHLPARMAGGHLPAVPALIETVVLMTLFRSVELGQAEEFFVPRSLFYWRSRAGAEVDAVCDRGRARFGVEVQDRPRVDDRELAPLRRSFPRGLIITSTLLDLDDPALPKVPAAVVLWLWGGPGIVLPP